MGNELIYYFPNQSLFSLDHYDKCLLLLHMRTVWLLSQAIMGNITKFPLIDSHGKPYHSGKHHPPRKVSIELETVVMELMSHVAIGLQFKSNSQLPVHLLCFIARFLLEDELQECTSCCPVGACP